MSFLYTSFNVNQSTHHRTHIYIPNADPNRFLPRSCVAVFAIKECERGVSSFTSTWTIFWDGLTDGVAFVVKRNMSKI